VTQARDEARAIRERFDPELVGEVLAVAEEVAAADPPAALGILGKMRATYDYLLAADVGPVTLGEEMEFAQDYLALEKLRLRNRLVVSLTFDGALADQEVPRRLLQPLIENTLLHGLSRELRQGRIAIRAYAEGARCIVLIEDNGRGFPHGFDPARADPEGGLARVRRWLQSAFGSESGLEIDPVDDGARVRIVIPRRDLTRPTQRAVAS
jgi:LytS/YehU family sensor histidine kinase